ncbi:MAG: methyltransferase domain-containing protein [Longimicrobiales bacterium]
MTRLRRVLQAQELLDLHQPNTRLLGQSLAHVAQVNRWLGGDRSVLVTLNATRKDGPLELLDVGTGSAALPRRIVRWARRRNLPIRVCATDINPQILALAREACRNYPEIDVQEANALRLPYSNGAFTHALLTLTLHHFEVAQQTAVLHELVRVSRCAVIISELERCWPNYLGARLLAATWWRNNPITRHDGPLSVLRAFTPAELRAAAQKAGVPGPVQRHFFFRLVLVAGNNG